MPYKGGMLDMKLLARRPCAGEYQPPFGLCPSIVTLRKLPVSALAPLMIYPTAHRRPSGSLGQFDTGQLEVLESPFLYGG